ncbi:pyridoxal-dependent decarboxylase [Acidocella sp. KAb 2-4]|uniref:pyridoxal phosphate-dependent decarboxylase family protein n=1 Tax=Acidocella sp. KAb 2-4 TaxID=2885158 RepID=UPI001D0952A2|nr:pyridoxal-dependent decarboxylase [Acidocella sp. KAb 2-4]MCB5944629.1 cytochrome D ubiquinol oxidase subunit I [Acidocella sp. KAb 2-4]
MSTLDPADWSALRALGHQMLDDMVDHLASIREQPVWRQMPDAVREGFTAPLPAAGTAPEALYERFRADIQPYVTGNTHPRFMGWVHGGGNPVSMLAELLAGAMNANCGGRDHVGIAVERQVIAWAAEMLGLPETTSGVLLTGSSMANFVAVLCARYKALGAEGRRQGAGGQKLVAYASTGVHRCVPGAMDMAGLGADALRRIPVDAEFRMDLAALRAAIAADRAAGLRPFLIIGTAGTVDVGAFDDLNALADLAAAENFWFHVDGAFGALAALSPTLKPLTDGIGRADSVAFDFHKWAQVTYDAGCVLVRDRELEFATFAQATNYLASAARGLAGGFPWPCDLGPDLSRGFRALKVWMTLSAYGSAALGGIVDDTCALAQRLAAHVRASNRLELLAPVKLNIVCFGINGQGDAALADLVADLQEEGKFAPSTTTIDGRLAIRVAIVNHRTTAADIDALAEEILRRI